MSIDRWSRGIAVLLGVALSGCVNLGPGTTEGPRLFLLGPLPETGQVAEPGKTAGSRGIVVGPVAVPEHLNRPQLVVRPDPYRVEASEGAQWAEPLDENITRVLAENLSSLLGTETVYLFPWDPVGPAAIQVAVDVVRFDATPAGTARLEARWTLRLPDRGVELRRATRVAVPVDGTGPEAQVAALSETLSSLGRDIAGAIRSLGP